MGNWAGCVVAAALVVLTAGCTPQHSPIRSPVATKPPPAVSSIPAPAASDSAGPSSTTTNASPPAEPPPVNESRPVVGYGDRRVADEPSAYGKFLLAAREADFPCQVFLRLSSGQQLLLLVVPECGEDGIVTLGAASRMGDVELPFVAPTGDEFHVFHIPTARGGNAVDADDYWVAVVRANDAWARSIDAARLNVGRRPESAPAVLVLEQAATTTDSGQRYWVSFGSVKETELPKLPSTIVSREKLELFGELSGGFHASNWRPVLYGEGKSTTIDDDGRCALPDIGQQYGAVAMKVEVTTWSDGRTRVKCLTFERLVLDP